MKLFCCSVLMGLMLFSCSEESKSNIEQDKKTISKTAVEAGPDNTYYPNGNLQITGKLNKAGLKDGIWISYFENGQKNSEANFKNGINDGYSMVWYPNGNVRYFGDYINGVQSGEWTYYKESGEIVDTKSY